MHWYSSTLWTNTQVELKRERVARPGTRMRMQSRIRPYLSGRAADDKVPRDAAPVALAKLGQAEEEQAVLLLDVVAQVKIESKFERN